MCVYLYTFVLVSMYVSRYVPICLCLFINLVYKTYILILLI